jgi:hypothetical protein
VEHEIQSEGLALAAETEVSTAVETAPAESAGANEAGSTNDDAGLIALGDDGNLIIGDDVVIAENFKPSSWEDKPEQSNVDALGVEQNAAQALPEVYNTQDLAKAFIENTVDASRIPPAMKEYYDAIIAEQTRRQEIQQLAMPTVQPQQMIPPPGPPPQPPTEQFKITKEEYKQLREGARNLAAKYVGVRPQDIDEYNQEHQEAVQLAMSQIQNRAQDIFKQQQAQQFQQAQQKYTQHAQAFQQQQLQIRQQQYQGIVKEFQKNPNWTDIDKNFYPSWFGKQDQRTQAAIQSIMASGDVNKVKQVMSSVFAAYDAQKKPAATRKAPTPVPQVMSAGNESDYGTRGNLADASKLADMSPEERGRWFIDNKLI